MITGITITDKQIVTVLARWAVDIGGCERTVRACHRALFHGCWHSRWQIADAYRDMVRGGDLAA